MIPVQDVTSFTMYSKILRISIFCKLTRIALSAKFENNVYIYKTSPKMLKTLKKCWTEILLFLCNCSTTKSIEEKIVMINIVFFMFTLRKIKDIHSKKN